jgi:hypothetical protein
VSFPPCHHTTPSLAAGVWPYSYNTCEGSGPLPWSSLDGQLITACPGDPPGASRAAWGLHPEQGRGAPEFDVFEVVTAVGGAAPPHTSQTLQMAPVMPQGTDWGTGPAAGGVAYPGAGSSFNTRRNSWQGLLGRPGNEYQDSISALSDLGPSFYTDQHTYGVDWRPGQVCQLRRERGWGGRGWVGVRTAPAYQAAPCPLLCPGSTSRLLCCCNPFGCHANRLYCLCGAVLEVVHRWPAAVRNQPAGTGGSDQRLRCACLPALRCPAHSVPCPCCLPCEGQCACLPACPPVHHCPSLSLCQVRLWGPA